MGIEKDLHRINEEQKLQIEQL